MKLQLSKYNINIHYIVIVGSRLHGLENENSDYDIKFVYTYSKDDVNGLVVPQDTLDDKNTNQTDKETLLNLFREYLPGEDLYDFSGFEDRKFFKNSMKSDPNMLDMLYAATVPDMVLYLSDEFQGVLENKELFVNMELAKKRFLGMSFNTYKLGSKQNAGKNKFKDLAKSLQSLYSFQNMVENEFSPRLKASQKAEVLAVKNNTYLMEHADVARVVGAMRSTLEEECEQLELPESKDNFNKLNALLLTLKK